MPVPDWDADSRVLRRNLARVGASIQRDAAQRVMPSVATAKVWQADMMAGLRVANPLYIGHFRGEPGLERCGVMVGPHPGVKPWEVAAALVAFEERLQLVIASLDAAFPNAESLDDDGMHAVIELAAWAHSEWVRIHPFANGNGRTARLWANLIFMRYGLPHCIALRPRPDGVYGAAGAAAMLGDRAPTIALFRVLLTAFLKAPPRS